MAASSSDHVSWHDAPQAQTSEGVVPPLLGGGVVLNMHDALHTEDGGGFGVVLNMHDALHTEDGGGFVPSFLPSFPCLICGGEGTDGWMSVQGYICMSCSQ